MVNWRLCKDITKTMSSKSMDIRDALCNETNRPIDDSIYIYRYADDWKHDVSLA